MTNNIGLYLHIPFCEKKCNYCDFYSSFVTEELLDNYTTALIKAIKEWGGKLKNRPIDTIYLGGGTPSLLNERIVKVLDAVRSNFNVQASSEITLELNPANDVLPILQNAKRAGVNRLSIGMQSANDSELEILGRRHTFADTVNTFNIARQIGFDNISLDIMLSLPFSSNETLKESLEKAVMLSPEHISAYILKIEENTAFYKKADSLHLPDDDSQAEQYLLMCSLLEKNGYEHYEISNFCKEKTQSRHNMKYWRCGEYLGLGPAAHSFLDGKRFYYPRNLKRFLEGSSPIFDGTGGNDSEYIMLSLRLKDGISTSEFSQKFGYSLPLAFFKEAELFKKAGLLGIENDRIFLNNKGMLVSNTIITKLLECIE